MIQKTFLLVVLSILGHWSMAQRTFTLDEAVTYAIDNSNAVKLKHLDVATAHSEIKEFTSIGLPQITAGVDYSYYFATPASPIEDFISPSVYEVLFEEGLLDRRELGAPRTFEFSFVQPHNLVGKIELQSLIFDGSYIYGLKAARLYKELVAKEVNVTVQDVKSTVTKAYMAILIAERNKEIIEKNITNVTKGLKESKAFFENGFAESLDVDRLSVSLDNLNTEKGKLENLIAISYNVLKFHMGFPLDEDLELTENIEMMEARLSYDETALDKEIDFSRRAEYAVLETSNELNDLDLKRNKMGYLPKLKAFASVQESLQRTELFNSNEAGWLPTALAGVKLEIPIYDGGEKSAKIQQVKINIDRVDIHKEEFKRGMALEIYNARLALTNATETLASRKRTLALSEKIYDKTLIKFREGVGSSVEVLQAESALYEAQGNYINSLYDLITAKTDLDIALGTL